MKNKREIEKQSEFCLELMLRLKDAIYVSHESTYWPWIENRTQHRQDIVRLRRELMTLSKILDS